MRLGRLVMVVVDDSEIERLGRFFPEVSGEVRASALRLSSGRSVGWAPRRYAKALQEAMDVSRALEEAERAAGEAAAALDGF